MGPLPCHWWEDGRGGRYLIPGCHSRVMDPDAEECSCPSTARRLETALRTIAALKRAARGRQDWHDAVVRAVYDHPDGVKIMKAAADAATSSTPATSGRTR
ncbi:hypothetical protein [Streptomyces sp. NPDC006355]|uniref:hypothetical protein n=1 Tax=Streptomyces sp. NPDC006355 TaxID=3156758 RepID=UPI0033A0A3B3